MAASAAQAQVRVRSKDGGIRTVQVMRTDATKSRKRLSGCCRVGLVIGARQVRYPPVKLGSWSEPKAAGTVSPTA